ncbi:MAG: RDD family protein [Gammaproteobacteria bacterium]|nr:RDD family protein [Gammaproteobacteria bacterium]MDX2486655.1 RDD family protein [Gammaproteobacteria bacterium]
MSEIKKSYGGFWKRVIAYLIDAFIIAFPVTMIFGTVIPEVLKTENVEVTTVTVSMPQIIMLVASWIYFAGLESSVWQATIGKKILGMKVTDVAGQRINFVKATVRYVAKFLSSFILMIGFIMVAFTAKKRGLHDFIAGTFVENKNN